MAKSKLPIKTQWELTRYFKDMGIIGFQEMKTAMLGRKRLAVLVKNYVPLDLSGLSDSGRIVKEGYKYLKKNKKITVFYESRRTAKKYTYKKKDDFYNSPEWRKVRYEAIKAYDRKCMCCGRNPDDHGIVIHVDHIKPRSTHRSLELEVSNLQLLCEDCNLGKSNRDTIDYRPKICAYCNEKTIPTCSPDNPCGRPRWKALK